MSSDFKIDVPFDAKPPRLKEFQRRWFNLQRNCTKDDGFENPYQEWKGKMVSDDDQENYRFNVTGKTHVPGTFWIYISSFK